MTLRRYPAYKESGTAWLGDVPQAWVVERLKRGFDLMKRPVLATDGNVTAFRDGQVTLRSNRRIDGFTEADKEIGYQGIEPNDLVIHAMDAFAGAIGVSDSRGKSTPVYSVCRAHAGYEPRYYALTLRHIALSGYITSLGKGVRERSTDFRWNDAQNVLVPVPPVDEQKAILNYLDAQTAKIDALIGKQEQLIETLAERRQALISHAVTKGLNPDVPMKDSGVAWLGNVPSHWAVTAMKRLLAIPITDGPHETPDFFDEGVPFVSAEAVSTGEIRFDKIRGHITEEEHARFSRKYFPKRDDIYVVKSGATTGVSAIVDTDVIFNIWSPLAAIRARSGVIPQFLLNFIRSREFQSAIELNWSYGTQQNIGMSTLGQLPVALPPTSEQSDISQFLSIETSQINALSTKAREMIEVLKERRQALISAAVTGKIDVGGLT